MQEPLCERLEQEKDQLLSQRGQAEQRCQSLGAINPVAELEQRQAALAEADAERQSLEQRGQALQLLLERFYSEQSHLANRYSEPLRAAIAPYLAEFATDPQQPLLAFDPQQGFHELQLRQGDEAFAFERLSGGMREQLSAAVRLAMAQVLKPAYDDVLPLVFDDAFTNSDRPTPGRAPADAATRRRPGHADCAAHLPPHGLPLSAAGDARCRQKKSPREARGDLSRAGRAERACLGGTELRRSAKLPAKDHSSSSSVPPTGIRRICLRPSLISNSSPGCRSSMAV